MNKIMYITFIITGAILISVGIIGLMNSNNNPTYNARIADTRTTNTIPEKAGANYKQPAITGCGSPSKSQSNNETHPSLSNKEKGNLFEGFVADCFKNKQDFRVLEWNQGVTSPEGVYAENNINPDFHIEQTYGKDFNIDYFIEAKYFSHWNSNQSIQLKDYQIDRYHKHQKISHRKVFLAIGVGGKPDAPADFYLIPIDSVKGYELSCSTLKQFAISQNLVRDYIYNYFHDCVFKKSFEK